MLTDKPAANATVQLERPCERLIGPCECCPWPDCADCSDRPIVRPGQPFLEDDSNSANEDRR
jgi:hypothetical protein